MPASQTSGDSPPPAERFDRLRTFLRSPWPVVLLLGCYVVLAISSAWRMSPTFDEGVHLTGGFSYWDRRDYRLHAENGHWSQRWAALPVWLSGYQFPPDNDPFWTSGYMWGVAERFFYDEELGNDADRMLWRGRMMILAAGVALGLVTYGWARQLFGAWGGLIALVLFAFSPTMLSHGVVVTSDMMVTLFLTAATWATWAMLSRVTPATFALCWFTFSGALMAKFSGLLILPIAAILVIVRLARGEPLPVNLRTRREIVGRARQLGVLTATFAALALGVALSIWASYGFRYSMMAPDAGDGHHLDVPWEKLKTSSTAINAAVDTAREFRLLPEGYLWGFTYMVASTEKRNAFLNGEVSMTGWRSFFLYCLALKTPLTLFLLLGIAGVAIVRYRPSRAAPPPGVARTANEDTVRDVRAPRLFDLTPLAVLLAVYWTAAIASNLNIGHRHIVPTYPAMFILAAGSCLWFGPAPRRAVDASASARVAAKKRGAAGSAATSPRLATAMRWTVAASLAIGVGESLWFWPHYLPYFNVLSGGPRHAYRYLVDSSLDWGQDLGNLKRWLDAHPEDSADPRRVYFAFFGKGRPEYYGIEAEILPAFHNRWRPHVPKPLTGGLYCISATQLQCVYLGCAGRWNLEYEEAYQQRRAAVEQVYRAQTDMNLRTQLLQRATPDQWQRVFYEFEELRFARLCEMLRQREPDDRVGYSILIYRLTDDEVREAVEGPLPPGTRSRANVR